MKFKIEFDGEVGPQDETIHGVDVTAYIVAAIQNRFAGTAVHLSKVVVAKWPSLKAAEPKPFENAEIKPDNSTEQHKYPSDPEWTW